MYSHVEADHRPSSSNRKSAVPRDSSPTPVGRRTGRAEGVSDRTGRSAPPTAFETARIASPGRRRPARAFSAHSFWISPREPWTGPRSLRRVAAMSLVHLGAHHRAGVRGIDGPQLGALLLQARPRAVCSSAARRQSPQVRPRARAWPRSPLYLRQAVHAALFRCQRGAARPACSFELCQLRSTRLSRSRAADRPCRARGPRGRSRAAWMPPLDVVELLAVSTPSGSDAAAARRRDRWPCPAGRRWRFVPGCGMSHAARRARSVGRRQRCFAPRITYIADRFCRTKESISSTGARASDPGSKRRSRRLGGASCSSRSTGVPVARTGTIRGARAAEPGRRGAGTAQEQADAVRLRWQAERAQDRLTKVAESSGHARARRRSVRRLESARSAAQHAAGWRRTRELEARVMQPQERPDGAHRVTRRTSRPPSPSGGIPVTRLLEGRSEARR